MSEQAQPSGRTRTVLKEIGGFEIVSKIGQGAMGAVFKARQKSLDRIVALKILPPSVAKDKAFTQRFVREARASAKLSHPNVVTGIDVGQDPKLGVWYFAMEFVEGPTCKQLLEERGTLPEDEALKIARDIAGALECAHQNGMVHRDVKPDNILIKDNGTAKLADLGLARQQKDDASLTQSGTALGTPFYMAPEQVRGQLDSLDTRTDLYALGATLFHFVTGEVPFKGETSAVIMARHLSDPPPMANRICPDVSAGCSKLILRLMMKEPGQRIQTPGELIQQIDRLLKLPTAARGVTTGPRVPIPGPTTTAQRVVVRPRKEKENENEPQPRNHALVYAAAGAGGVIVLGLVALLIVSSSRRPSEQAKSNKATKKAQKSVVASAQPKSATPKPIKTKAQKPQEPPAERRWRQAKAYAEAHPDAFAKIVQRYRQAMDTAKAAASPLATEIETALQAAEARYEEAMEKAWQTIEQTINHHVAANDYDAALEATRALPPGMAQPLQAKANAKRQSLVEEAKAKFAAVVAAAEAASTEADPEKGLKALEAIAHLKFKPMTSRIEALTLRLKTELANVDELRARKAQRGARKRLTAVLERFDNALLKRKDKTAAGRVAAEAKTAQDLDLVRAEVDAMGAILEASVAEAKRQEEALKGLKGQPFQVGTDKGVIDRVEDGKLFVKISLGGGKIMATKTLEISKLSQEQKRTLFPSPGKPSAALTVNHALQKLVTGQEDLEAAERLLGSAPDFPLTPHYMQVIQVRRAAAAESLAQKAWGAVAESTGKATPSREQAMAAYKKLQSFLEKYGHTQFAKGKAEEIAAVRARIEAIASPNLLPNGNFEAGHVNGWEERIQSKAHPVKFEATARAAHAGKYGLEFKGPGWAEYTLALEAGQTYRFSCWAKVVEGVLIRVSLDRRMKRDTSRRGRAAEFQDWQKLTFTFEATKPNHLIALQAHAKRDCQVYFDDIEVVKVGASTPVTAADGSEPAPATAVPADAKRFGGHAYKVFERSMEWDDARIFCKEQGGYLVCIETEAEARFISELTSKRVWVGASREDGHWTWVNGALFDRNIGQMHFTGQASERYLSIDGQRFHDTPKRKLPCICEWEVSEKPTPPAPPPAGASAVQFMGEDAKTQGTWQPTYGKAGYVIAGGPSRLPKYAKLENNNELYFWEKNTKEPHAVQLPDSERRVAAAWHNEVKRAPAVIKLSLTDGRDHAVSLYMMEFKSRQIRTKVILTDEDTGKNLDTRVVHVSRSGRYLTWRVKGHIRITLIPGGGGKYATVSGIFFQ